MKIGKVESYNNLFGYKRYQVVIAKLLRIYATTDKTTDIVT